ncbi:metal homeostatis protein bsd2 [Cryptococcus deuterogattii MMRL2647]|nr:metal homeostatis protein bsd2 [Cryptococcus deuterogattii MMRL2647]
MSRYDPIQEDLGSLAGPASSGQATTHSARSSRHRPRRHASMPDPGEMDAAFDGPDADNDELDQGETHGLLSSTRDRGMPGDYDFERDYTLPPPSPPPFEPYSAHNPAPGNSHGIIPTSVPVRPRPAPQRHFLGGLLPSSFLPRQQSQAPSAGRALGGGMSGVFDNLAARPDRHTMAEGEGGLQYVPEDESKDAPPSYQTALRDAVPPYWDTTVVLPSSSSPFGPLSSSISGDEILIDGMPSGNFFSFLWNLVVSASFQFVGFLLTYVLHTTHAAKYGSRAGLGLTLIQVGLNLRSKAQDLMKNNAFPSASSDPSDPDPPPNHVPSDEEIADNAIEAIWGPGASPWPAQFREPGTGDNGPVTIVHNTHEAEMWAVAHNTTLTQMLNLPSAADVGRANEWFSFFLMSIGWFIVLTSVGGWWRVKRFERGLRAAQRESEAAQAAAAANSATENGEDGASAPEADESINTSTGSVSTQQGPTQLSYWTSPFTNAWQGARHIQEGFLGQHGPRSQGRRGWGLWGGLRGQGHTAVSQEDDEHELLDAQGFGLGPMAIDVGEAPGAEVRRQRSLWS